MHSNENIKTHCRGADIHAVGKLENEEEEEGEDKVRVSTMGYGEEMKKEEKILKL